MARVNFEIKYVFHITKGATPWPRLGFSNEMAQAILLFCLSASQWITGQVFAEDGGISLGVLAE